MDIFSLDQKKFLKKDVVKLIEKRFAYKDGFHFDEDFYPLINKRNYKNCFIALSYARDVMGHVGIKVKKINGLQIGFIGGIAVSEHFEGQGVMKELLNHCINAVPCDAYLLWSDLHEMYKKFGFAPAGTQLQSGFRPIDSAIEAQFKKTKFCNLNDRDFNQIRELYNLSVERNSEDWEEIKLIRSADLYVHYCQPQKIDGYFVANKGMDLTGIIHEFVGSKELLDLVKDYYIWLPEIYESIVPNANRQIIALAKGPNDVLSKIFTPSLYLSGLDSV